MTVYLQIAWRNLVQARRRTFLLGGALSAVTFLLVVLMALSQGLSVTMVRAATSLAAGHVNVAGFYKDKPESAAPLVTDADKVMELIKASTPNLVHMVDRQRGWAKIVSDTASLQSALTGLDIDAEHRLRDILHLAREDEYVEGGRAEVLGNLDDINKPGNIMIFVSQAKRLEVTVGDPLTLAMQTMDGMRNSIDVTVAAIARDIGMNSRWQMLMSKDEVLKLYKLKKGSVGAVFVYVDDIEQAPQVMRKLHGAFEEGGWRMMKHRSEPFWMKFEAVASEDWVGQKLDLTTWDDEVSFLKWIVTGFDAIAFFLIGLLLLIICVGIANTMWIAVRERTGEVGTLRAIGMKRGQVLMLFMTEAMLLALAASGLGALVGAVFAASVHAAEVPVPSEAIRMIFMADTFQLVVKAVDVIAAVAAFSLVTGLAALGPAIRAARLEPVTAIHRLD